ncbi:MAG: bile acid:sodium symporter family protein [Bacteroidales bacterium]|nr:bile acid:sodium symporter family protein [Bacteroidales bacterium]
MYETFQDLDNLRLHFDQGGLFALNISLGIIMFGVALGIRLRNFKTLFLRPKPLIIGFISQFFALPLFTFLLALAFHNYITVGVALGMILVAACPGGNISNFISSLAKGNVELSISLTAIATMMAVVMTPFNFALWGDLYISYLQSTDSENLLQPLKIDAFEMFKSVFILLGIPVILGMIFAWKLPNITAKIIKPIRTISILVFMAIVVLAFVKNYDYFVKFIFYIMIIVLIHNALALTTGFSLASIFKIDRSNRRTITIETGIQNSGLALVLLFNEKIFPADLPIGGMLFIAGWWGIWHMISGIGLAGLWSKIPLKKF